MNLASPCAEAFDVKLDEAGVREMHDRLVAMLPAGMEHDASTCPMCALAEGAVLDQGPGGTVDTFTKDQLDAATAEAVRNAVAPLEVKITELEGAKGQQETAEAVAAATEPLEARVTELENELDVKTNEAQAAKDELASVLAWLDEEGTKAEEAKAADERRDERVEKVKEVAHFTDEQITERQDRWAAMADADFDALLADLAITAGDNAGGGTDPLVVRPSPLRAREEPTGGGGKAASPLRDAMALRGTPCAPNSLV